MSSATTWNLDRLDKTSLAEWVWDSAWCPADSVIMIFFVGGKGERIWEVHQYLHCRIKFKNTAQMDYCILNSEH